MNSTPEAWQLPEPARRVLRRIEAAQRPLIVSHIRLDGDALGTELALFHMLEALGKAPHVVNDSAIPQIYRFLPGIESVGVSAKDLRSDYDLVVMVDNPTWSRAKAIKDALPEDLPIVAIDHHPPVEQLGEAQWVETARSSVGEMVYYFARAARWPVPPEAATCLYVAIMTDTGRFAFPNTSADALRAAAELVELGAEHVRATEQIYQEVSYPLVTLRGEATQGMKLFAGGKIALMTLTHEMLERNGVDPIDTQEFADYPRSVAGVVIGVLLREMKVEGRIKVSLRSRHKLNIEPIARKYGGGGHREAAGAEVPGSVAEVERLVITDLIELLRREGIA